MDQGAAADDTGDRPQGPARRCRFCLDWVRGEDEPLSYADKIRGKRPRRIYRDEEGILIAPCMCRGSMNWIHDSCLANWRYASDQGGPRLECETCHFRFQTERVAWARRIRSPILAFCFAVLILVCSVFLLGFIADPILNLWADPLGTVAHITGFEELEELSGFDAFEGGWSGHFLKGTLSLGLLGFVKAFLAMSPWQWWNLRAAGITGGGRRGVTGRHRTQNISLALVMIGVLTFFWAVWTATRAWTQRVLDRTSERVMNAREDDDDDDEEDNVTGQAPQNGPVANDNQPAPESTPGANNDQTHEHND